MVTLYALALAACGDDEGEQSASAAAEPVAPAPSSPSPSAANSTASQNAAPRISGDPSKTVMAGQPYAFTPVATDTNGDALVFSAVNVPPWAQLDPLTGRLSGTPTPGDVATYANIVVSASDGQATVSLPAFSIDVVAVATGSVTLTWEAPTQNVDGSPLTDLAGYRLYWGPAPGNYSSSVTIANPGITTYVVEQLTPGTWYFVATALNSRGVESGDSNLDSTTIL
jgi:hypothetical protein